MEGETIDLIKFFFCTVIPGPSNGNPMKKIIFLKSNSGQFINSKVKILDKKLK